MPAETGPGAGTPRSGTVHVPRIENGEASLSAIRGSRLWRIEEEIPSISSRAKHRYTSRGDKDSPKRV